MIIPEDYPFQYQVLESNVFRITSPYNNDHMDFSYNPATFTFYKDLRIGYKEYYHYLAYQIAHAFKDNINYVGRSARQTECVRNKIKKKMLWSSRRILKAIFVNEITPQILPSILEYHKNFFKYHQRMMDLDDINSIRINHPRLFTLGCQSIYPFTPESSLEKDPDADQLMALKSINGNIYKDMIGNVINQKPIRFPITNKYHFVSHYHINEFNPNSNVWKLSKEQFPVYMKEAVKLGFFYKAGKRLDRTNNILSFCQVFDDKIGNI